MVTLLSSLSTLIGEIAHLIGVCLVIYAILIVVQGLSRGDMIGSFFRAAVAGIGSAILMRI